MKKPDKLTHSQPGASGSQKGQPQMTPPQFPTHPSRAGAVEKDPQPRLLPSDCSEGPGKGKSLGAGTVEG